MKARLTMFCLTVLGVAMLLAGCGGSDESASADTTLTVSSLSKPQFVKQANAICYRAKTQQARDLQEYFEQHKNLPRANPGVEAVDEILIPSVEEQLSEVRELGAPAGDVGQIEAMWSGIERSIGLIEEEGLSASPAIRHAFLPNGQRIYVYGMGGCAYGR